MSTLGSVISSAQNSVSEENAIRNELYYEMVHVTRIMDEIEKDVDILLPIVAPNGPLRKAIESASEMFQQLLEEYELLSIVPRMPEQ